VLHESCGLHSVNSRLGKARVGEEEYPEGNPGQVQDLPVAQRQDPTQDAVPGPA